MGKKCEHIADGVSKDFLENIEEKLQKYTHDDQQECRNGTPWKCKGCGSSEEPWMCLSCGDVLCSRYINAHGMQHFKQSKDEKHSIFINCLKLGIYCYSCDDYVYDDTEENFVRKIQEWVDDFNRKNKVVDDDNFDLGTEEEDEQGTHSVIGRVVENDEDSRSVPEDAPYSPQLTVSYAGSLYGGRLRPRKRTHSRSPSAGYERKMRHTLADCKLRGLRNLGNTCFINSVVQALSVSDIFREYLVKLPLLEPDDDDVMEYIHPVSPRYNTRRAAASKNNKSDDSLWASSLLTEELRKLFINLLDTSVGYVYSPDEFFRAVWQLSPRFRGFQQQDAHDFLRATMERLHCELRRCRIPESADAWLSSRCSAPVTPTSSAITRIFEGSLLSQVICLTCHTASNKQETFMDLSLEISDPANTNCVKLSDCIHRFFAKEELEQREQYMCGHCMDKRPSTKQLMLSVLPTILCLHLKRFRWTQTSRGKLDIMVEFPLSGLDIRPFMTAATSASEPQCNFELSSVVVHHGSGFSSGHYTTFGRRNNNWYHFNDSAVKPISEQVVLQQKAYLLFYTRSQ